MIFDSSSLIIFGKLNKLSIILKLLGNIEIAEEVYREAIFDGLGKRFEDSLILKNYLDKGKITVIKLNDEHLKLADKIQNLNNIGLGESQTIALARQIKRKDLVIDESLAREAAKAFGLNPIGSLRVLLLAYEKNMLNEKEVKETVNKMISLKFRLSAATLIRFWELFDKMKK